MAKCEIMKAVEFDSLPVKFRKIYPTLASLRTAGWWAQAKYDGCFGKAIVRADGDSRMESRTGEDYTASCGHILDELREAVADEFEDGIRAVVVLGEVWHPAMDFPTISGKFRKAAPSNLCFVANDILPAGMTTETPYFSRYAALARLLGEGDFPLGFSTRLAETYHDFEWDDAKHLAQTFVSRGGYDGAILRDPKAGYTIGPVKRGEIVKVKPVISLDLRVLDVVPGEGKHAGRIGALRVGLGALTTDVGTGLSDEERGRGADYWVGKIVEIEAMGFSTEHKLREPRFKGERFDKTTADL